MANGFPDATNTGVPDGVTLKTPTSSNLPAGVTINSSGDITINQAGVVLSGYNITGSVTINASNVTLQNCQITSDGFSVLINSGATNVTVQDCSIDNLGSGGEGINVYGDGAKLLRNDIQHAADGINVGADNILIQDNYIHDLSGTASSHIDGIQADGSFSGLTIKHNTVIAGLGDVSALMLDNYWGTISNVVVDSNYFGGGGFTVYLNESASGTSGGPYPVTNVSFTNNVLSKGKYGYIDLRDQLSGTSFTISGNTDASSGALIPGQTASAPSSPSTPSTTPAITGYSTDTGTAGDNVTSDKTLTLTGTAAASTTVKIYDGSTQVGSTTSNSSGAWSYTTGTLSDGSHSLTAATTNSSNVTTTSTALSVTVDSLAPNKPVIASFSPDTNTVGDGITTANMITLAGTAEANSVVSVYDGTTLLGSATTNSSGAWTYTTGTLQNATHSLTATAADKAGNISAASGALSVTVNAVAPQGTPAGQNLIANGGFETGNFSGWTLGGNYTNKQIYIAPTDFSLAVHGGTYAAGLGSMNQTDGTLSQDVATTAGQHYTLQFWLANSNGVASPQNHLSVSWNGQTLLALSNVTSFGYTVYTYDVVGVTGTSHLEFDSYNTPDAFGLDDMSLTAVGTPSAPAAPTAAPAIASFSNDSGVAGDGITNDNTLTLTGTAVANSTVKVYDGTTLLGQTTANSSGAWSYTPAALQDGGHSLTATATSNGSTSVASAVLAVTIDTAGPGAPAIASYSNDTGVSGDGITSDNTLTMTGTAAANSTVKVYDGSTLLGQTTANGSGAWSYTTGALPDGGHSLTATASDIAGNVSAASAALAMTVDTQAPGAPVIASFSPDTNTVGDGITSATTLTLTGTAAANSTVKVFDNGSQIGIATANGGGAWTYTTGSLSFSTHAFTATSTDAAGNASAASSALNVSVTAPPPVAAPGAPSIASFSNDTGVAGDRITSDNTPTLTGTATANSTVKVYDGANLLGQTTANSSGAWTYTTGALIDGAHNLTATATSNGSTSAASAALAVTIDTQAPNTPAIASFSNDTGAAGDRITSDNTLTLAGTAAANSTVRVYDGANLLGQTTANGSGAWSYTTAALSDGAHNLNATATDVAGNVSAASAALAVTVDTVAPVAPTFSSYSADTPTVLTLTGNAEANSTVTLFDITVSLTNPIGTTTTNSSGAWSFTTGNLTAGEHDFTAAATDAAGNTSVVSAPLDPLIPASSGANLVVNGGFETGDFSGWNRSGNYGSIIYNGWQTYINNDDHSGTYAAALGSMNSDGVLSQKLQTTAGQHYTLDFWLKNGNGGGSYGADNFVVKWNGEVVMSLVNIGKTGWTEYKFDVVGTAGTSTLEFFERQDPTHWTLDDVLVTTTASAPAPAPDITSITQLSGGYTKIGGTATPNTALSVFDNGSTTPLGTVNVGTDGTWSVTTKLASSSVTHSFTATDKDAMGHVGSTTGLSLLGTGRSDTLKSGSGNDLMVGNSGSDAFVFQGTKFGNDTIADFRATGGDHDVLQFSKTAFSSIASIFAHAAQVGSDTIVSLDATDSVTLKNVQLSDLKSYDFLLS